MAYDSIDLNVDEGVATVTFSRPRYMNSLTTAALQEIMDALYRIEADDDIGVVVLTGEGEKAFCAGIDLKEVPLTAGRDDVGQHFRLKAMWWHQVAHKITRIRKPVLSAVNGVAAGGGFGMVLASDIAVAVDSATFLCTWHSNGVANDGATSYTLAKIVGFRRAMELMLTNRTLDSSEALEWQIVNRVYSLEDFHDNVARIAADLARGPTHLQAMAKERFHMGWRQSIEECTEFEIQNIMDSLDNPYFGEMVAKFQGGRGKNDEIIVKLP